MKDAKTNRDCEVKPSRSRPEHPDNGYKLLKEQGPNSGAWKNNPHRHQSLAQHAWFAR